MPHFRLQIHESICSQWKMFIFLINHTHNTTQRYLIFMNYILSKVQFFVGKTFGKVQMVKSDCLTICTLYKNVYNTMLKMCIKVFSTYIFHLFLK